MGEGVAPTVCISASGNTTNRVRRQKFFKRYREALGRDSDLGGTPVVCGILLCRAAGTRWRSEAFAMNSVLADHYKRNGWLFVDDNLTVKTTHTLGTVCTSLLGRLGCWDGD